MDTSQIVSLAVASGAVGFIVGMIYMFIVTCKHNLQDKEKADGL